MLDSEEELWGVAETVDADRRRGGHLGRVVIGGTACHLTHFCAHVVDGFHHGFERGIAWLFIHLLREVGIGVDCCSIKAVEHLLRLFTLLSSSFVGIEVFLQRGLVLLLVLHAQLHEFLIAERLFLVFLGKTKHLEDGFQFVNKSHNSLKLEVVQIMLEFQSF